MLTSLSPLSGRAPTRSLEISIHGPDRLHISKIAPLALGTPSHPEDHDVRSLRLAPMRHLEPATSNTEAIARGRTRQGRQAGWRVAKRAPAHRRHRLARGAQGEKTRATSSRRLHGDSPRPASSSKPPGGWPRRPPRLVKRGQDTGPTSALPRAVDQLQCSLETLPYPSYRGSSSPPSRERSATSRPRSDWDPSRVCMRMRRPV